MIPFDGLGETLTKLSIDSIIPIPEPSFTDDDTIEIDVPYDDDDNNNDKNDSTDMIAPITPTAVLSSDTQTITGKTEAKAKKAVKEGWSIMIFPEGTIPDNENPKMQPFKMGAFKLAKALEIPIVPITFMNNFKLFSEPTNLRGTAYPGYSNVHIHSAINSETIRQLSDKELSDLCYQIINAPLLEAYPDLCMTPEIRS